MMSHGMSMYLYKNVIFILIGGPLVDYVVCRLEDDEDVRNGLQKKQQEVKKSDQDWFAMVMRILVFFFSETYFVI